VRTACDDENVSFTIADNGPGVPADRVSRVFEPYYTTKKTGSGLGLLIVHRIVHDHGGEVEFKSREGLGTEVTVYLPRTEKRMRFLPSKAGSAVIDVEVEG
jgi:signal transduction histidine kinase